MDICGSDVHYVEHGGIGAFVMQKPMILGHEASGTVVTVGADVQHLKVGDRVALEPGIPHRDSVQTLSGFYNLDPELTFFATPPIDGCLCTAMIHPAALCFKLPDNVSYEEGAMCEPLAVGMHSATKAGFKPGDVGLVFGCGTIGIVTALCTLAGGCSIVFICDVVVERLKMAERYPGLVPMDARLVDCIKDAIAEATDGNGADCIFECSGAMDPYAYMREYAAPGATCVLVGMPVREMKFDVFSAQPKELTFQTIFCYRNAYPRVIRLLSAGKLDVKPLITADYAFKDSIKANGCAYANKPTDVKVGRVFSRPAKA